MDKKRTNSNVRENDVVHVLADQQPDKSYIINDSHGYLIINPHYILSGTNIISGLGCLRRSVLNWSFKDTGSGSIHMVLGNILHELFQSSITNRKYEKNELNALLIDILKRKQIVNQLYESNMSEEHVLKETCVYLASIEKWLHQHVKVPLSTNNGFGFKKAVAPNNDAAKNLQITNVCDIEESIWSPKYGCKGKLDLTLQVEIKPSAFKTLGSNNNNAGAKKCNDQLKTESHVIPVELKSGRTTFSAEHEGQVMLYSLLNNEKRKKSDFGLLLYLKDMNMKFIKVSETSLRGFFFKLFF